MTNKNRHDFDPRAGRCRRCGCKPQAAQALEQTVLCGRDK